MVLFFWALAMVMITPPEKVDLGSGSLPGGGGRFLCQLIPA
ncbi:MAG: hypothetical protein M5U34_35860 [Chloroflexi bacterium]|nr:hypothetical protein [Chloroflexota bacterium]